jgi:hypothetical protein
LLLGRRSETGSADFFSGLLDEVTVWNAALTQTQIQANKNRSLTGTEPGLLAYYVCDESGGTYLVDSAPAASGNHGTLNGGAVFTLSGVLPFTPAAETLPASGIGGTTATLNGVANPEGTNTSAWFEWGTTDYFGAVTPLQSVGSGASSVSFSQELPGLAVNTTYYFRAVASNSLGVAIGTDGTFTTLGPPRVQTLPATATGPTTDTLNGVVNPGGLNSRVWFEWGTTTNHGNRTAIQSVGNGMSSVNFSHVLTGLVGRITYHFRAVASNAMGVAIGADATLDRFGFDSIQRLPNGRTEITLGGAASSACLVDASTNLAQWNLIDCIYAEASQALLEDPAASELDRRFYRGRSIPASLQRLFHFTGESFNGSVLFRQPSYSGSTSHFIDQNVGGDSSRVTANFPTGLSAGYVLHVRWGFTNGAVNPWVRLITFNTPSYPNPTISFAEGLCFDFFTDRDVYLTLGLRETSEVGFIGEPGGTSGPIEWVGATTDNSASPPRGRLIVAGQWRRVCFFIPEEPVRSFVGNGVLTPTGGLGVFEHIAVVPVIGSGAFNIYFGEFHRILTGP